MSILTVPFAYHQFYLYFHILFYHLIVVYYFPKTFFPTSWNPSLVQGSQMVFPANSLFPPISRLLTEWLLSSLSGRSSETPSSTARTAHRDPGAACSCSSTSAPGSCWEGEKPRETWGRKKNITWGSGKPGQEEKKM